MVQRGDRRAVSGGAGGGVGPGGEDGGDWTVQAADTVERVVGTIRDKTAVPLVTLARGVVFGLLAAVLGAVVVVLLVAAAVRGADAIVNVTIGEGNVWIAYLVVGGLFSVAGVFLLRKATATTAR